MKKIMTLFVVCMMCLSLVGCAPAVMGYPMAGQIQNSWPYLTIQSSKMSQKTSTPKLESNSALVTVDGKTELLYLSNAYFLPGYYMLDTGKKVYHDYFYVCFYSYDSAGQIDKSLNFELTTVGGRAETGKIMTQDDVTKTGEGRHGDVRFAYSTATDVWEETDYYLEENKNDYTIEIVEVIEPEKTYRIRGTFKPTVSTNNKNEKTKDVEFEALFTIGEVHSVVDSHGDSGRRDTAYSIRNDKGSGSKSSGSSNSGSSNSGSSNSGSKSSGSSNSGNSSSGSSSDDSSDVSNGGSSESSGESKGSNPYDTKHVCGGCNGKKVLTCPVCHGLKTCMTCNGDGYSNGMKCISCNKKGICSNCRGKGEVKCTTCSGKGYRY